MALWLNVEPQTAVNADLKLSIILDADTRANNDELFTRLDWLPLHLDVNVNICIQVHKRINGRSPGYMSDLLVLNWDINERNNRNNSLNLVCPRFNLETVGGGEGGEGIQLVWGQQDSGILPNSLKRIECGHSFKRP